MLFKNYRVDSIPKKVKAAAGFSYGYYAAWARTLAFAVDAGLKNSCNWQFKDNNTKNAPSVKSRHPKQCIHCTCHANIPAYLIYYRRGVLNHHHRSLVHLSAYMKLFPQFLNGRELITTFGSISDNCCKQHQDSTAFFPDCPNDPVRQLKPGVVDMAIATGLPIVPIRSHFSTVQIEALEPLYLLSGAGVEANEKLPPSERSECDPTIVHISNQQDINDLRMSCKQCWMTQLLQQILQHLSQLLRFKKCYRLH